MWWHLACGIDFKLADYLGYGSYIALMGNIKAICQIEMSMFSKIKYNQVCFEDMYIQIESHNNNQFLFLLYMNLK